MRVGCRLWAEPMTTCSGCDAWPSAKEWGSQHLQVKPYANVIPLNLQCDLDRAVGPMIPSLVKLVPFRFRPVLDRSNWRRVVIHSKGWVQRGFLAFR